jgi:hypothetical protein
MIACATTGFEHTPVLWRHEAMAATLRFQTLAAQDECDQLLLRRAAITETRGDSP